MNELQIQNTSPQQLIATAKKRRTKKIILYTSLSVLIVGSLICGFAFATPAAFSTALAATTPFLWKIGTAGAVALGGKALINKILKGDNKKLKFLALIIIKLIVLALIYVLFKDTQTLKRLGISFTICATIGLIEFFIDIFNSISAENKKKEILKLENVSQEEIDKAMDETIIKEKNKTDTLVINLIITICFFIIGIILLVI